MRLLVIMLVAAAVSGCSRWQYELGRELSPIEGASPGSALPLADVLRELGPPQRISALNEGYVLGWEYWRIRKTAIGISLGPTGIDLLAIDWGNAQVDGQVLFITFDLQHRLTASSFSRWNREAGSGSALQPALLGMSLVDIDDLLQPLPQHHWGGLGLRSLPETLNAGSSPVSGQAGIEQRGTPAGVGQRSLELQH